MRVYLAVVHDKSLYPEEAPNNFMSMVAEGTAYELKHYDECLPEGISDEDIHYYFGEGEHDFNPGSVIETDEFIYTIYQLEAENERRVA